MMEMRHSTGDWNRPFTRRRLLHMGLGLSAVALLPAACGGRSAPSAPTSIPPTATPTSTDDAYAFLRRMMDLHASGETTRIVQSYLATSALDLADTAFTYDNAIALLAFVERGEPDDLHRATILADSFLYAQQHDPQFVDGRLRNSYHAAPLIEPGGQVSVGNGGTSTGNMAWAGLALTSLFRATLQQRHLQASTAIGAWIRQNAYDLRGVGGFTDGIAPDASTILQSKSTENNLDALAFFRRLYTLTGDAVWQGQARHARRFVRWAWNPVGGYFRSGTGPGGLSLQKAYVPENAQSWSYLVLRDPAYAGSLDWAIANLSASDAGFNGVSYSTADRSGVWFEGTSHMALALLWRNARNDRKVTLSYLRTVEAGQKGAPNRDGYGIDAASHDGLQAGDGDSYFAALHTGTTAWYCLAQRGTNPFDP